MTTKRDKSGWLPNMLGPVKLNADGIEQTMRGILNFIGITITDDEENDTMNLQWQGDASSIGGVAVTGPGNVPVDAATFGTDGRIKSYVFRGAGDTDNLFTVDVYTIPDLTTADVVITVVWKRGATTNAYRRDHRFLVAKNGATLTEHLQEDGTEHGYGLFTTGHSAANFAAGKITMSLTGIADEPTRYTITVQVQETHDA